METKFKGLCGLSSLLPTGDGRGLQAKRCGRREGEQHTTGLSSARGSPLRDQLK